jgi:hypothetical protein
MTDSGWRKRQIALDANMKTVIEMASEVGMLIENDSAWGAIITTEPSELKAFAALVAAAEREACAKLAAATICDTHIPTGIKIYGTVAAKAIRARSQTPCKHEWIDATTTKPQWHCAKCGKEYKKEQP